MISISLEGISSGGGNETRALAHLKVLLNGTEYSWQVYIPENTANLEEFLSTISQTIEANILAKEAEWEVLTPKTKLVPGPFGDENITVDINKDEVVRPDIPDYYALRRDRYPSLGEQLGALWKGPSSSDYLYMAQKIQDIKDKYPK